MPAINTNTKLACNFQSRVDGSGVIRDYGQGNGGAGYIVSMFGNAALSTAIATPATKFPKPVLALDGTGDYVSIPDNADWNFGTNVFTIDGWFYLTSDVDGTLWGHWQNAANQFTLDYSKTNGYFDLIIRDASTWRAEITANWAPSINTWYHIAVIRKANNNLASDWMITINGVPLTLSLGAGAWNGNIADVAAEFGIGGTSGHGANFPGYMTEFRISNVARWTDDFSASLPTAPYGSDSNTLALLHMSSYDCCPTPKVLTFIGTAQIDTAQFKFGESSLLLDGDSDYIQIPDSSDWNFGANNFTLACWVRYNTTTGSQWLMSQGSADGNNMWGLYKTSGQRYQWLALTGGVSVGNYYSAVQTINAGQWYFITVTRSGSSLKIYVDGVPLSLTESQALGTLGDYAGTLNLGVYPDLTSEKLNGWMDCPLIINGTALWNADFSASLPTTPYYSKYYSRGGPTSLPTTNANQATIYTEEEYYQIMLADSIEVSQLASVNNYAIHIFKDVTAVTNNRATVTWTGKTDVAGSASHIFLDAWNVNGSTWDNLVENDSATANVNFTMAATLNLQNYKTSDGEIICRVYQRAV